MAMDFFIMSGAHNCDGCGLGIYASDVDDETKGAPVVFDVECEEHGDRQVMFHEKCMPEDYRAAREQRDRAEKAHLN